MVVYKTLHTTKVFIGKNYEKITKRPFNFAAFFFTSFYLFYRKMFGFGKSQAAKEMDLVLKSLQLAFENNYKDNATANLKKLEQMYEQAVGDGRLKEKEKQN